MSGLTEESLLTLEETARDFGGIAIPLNTRMKLPGRGQWATVWY